MTKKESNIMLFSITLCWASSYIFIKDLPEDLSSCAYLTLTAGIGGLILLAVFYRSLPRVDKMTAARGFVLAALTAGNMLLEKGGLSYLPSSTASFLGSLNIMFVPMILLLFKKFPSRNNVAGILVILTGLFVSKGVSFQGGFLAGTMYMLGACVLMSVYTVAAAEFSKKSDPLLLSVLQICFSAVMGFFLWFWEDPATFAHISWSKRMLSSIFILAFFSKAYAYIMLMYAEKYADAISVTIIASTEPVVTLALALLIPNMRGETESFSARALAGAMVIAAGAMVAGFDFLSPKKKTEAVPVFSRPEGEKRGQEVSEAPGPPYGQAGQSQAGRRALRQFLLSMIPFAVLGAAFKVMVLVEGFTEVRPANAIPVVAGLAFGAIGGLGCAVGNLIADFFGTLNLTSLLGLAGNFMAAYLPYRVWYSVRDEKPNVRTWKNLLVYLWAACLGALCCAWILGFGLELFFGLWIESIYKYVLLNNLGFSVVLGLPVFILVTSDSFCLDMRLPGRQKGTRGSGKWQRWILGADTVLLLMIMAGVYMGYHLNHRAMYILSALAAAGLAAACGPPLGKVRGEETMEDRKKGKGQALVILLLAVNLMVTGCLAVYLAVAAPGRGREKQESLEGGVLADQMGTGDKYILYIGLNDKDTYTQLIPEEEARELVSSICVKYVGGYTASWAKGGWVDETDTLTQENTLVYSFYDVEEGQLISVMDEILEKLNQNSILIERQKAVYTYYTGSQESGS